MRDKELRTVGTRSRICHGQSAGSVVSQGRVEFVLKTIAGASGSCPERATSLDHEIANDPMKI